VDNRTWKDPKVLVPILAGIVLAVFSGVIYHSPYPTPPPEPVHPPSPEPTQPPPMSKSVRPQSLTNCPSELNGQISYTDFTTGIRIRYPSHWTVQYDQNNSVNFFSPSDTAKLHVHTAPESRTLDQYTKTHTAYERQKALGFILLENTTVLLGKNEGYKLVYMYKDSKSNTTMAMEEYFIKDGKIYIFAFYSQPATYHCHLPIIQSMINSFALLG
jgi:hypothetical protein